MNSKSRNIIIELKNQIVVLDSLIGDYVKCNLQPGVEQKLTFDITESIRRYKRHTNRFIYHAENFIRKLEEFKAFGPISLDPTQTLLIDETVFFDFDAFIVTLSGLFEEPFRQDAQQVLSSSNYNLFEENFPTKKNENSLIWRLTILRNRIVHPDNATYGETGSRYMEFSSYGVATVKNGELIAITANLIDISKSIYLKKILKNQVIDETQRLKKEYKENKKKGESPCRPEFPDFHKIVFGKSKKPKNEKGMLYVGGVNLIETFHEILQDAINNLKKVNAIYAKELQGRLGANFYLDRVFIKNENGLFDSWRDNGEINKNEKSQGIMEIFKEN